VDVVAAQYGKFLVECTVAWDLYHAALLGDWLIVYQLGLVEEFAVSILD